jgi:hypothetical protein
MRINNILEIVGLDFLMWEFKNDSKFNIRTKELKDVVLDLKKYQERVASGNVKIDENIGEEIFDNIDISLKKLITKFNLELKDIKYKPSSDYDRPYYSVVNTNENGFCITFINDKKEKMLENVELLPKLKLDNLKNEKTDLDKSDFEVIESLKDKKYREILQSQAMDEDVKKGASYKSKCLIILNEFLKEDLAENNEKNIKDILSSIKRNQLSSKRLKSLLEVITKIKNSMFIDDALTKEDKKLKTYIEKGINETLTKKEDLQVFSFVKGVADGNSKV